MISAVIHDVPEATTDCRTTNECSEPARGLAGTARDSAAVAGSGLIAHLEETCLHCWTWEAGSLLTAIEIKRNDWIKLSKPVDRCYMTGAYKDPELWFFSGDELVHTEHEHLNFNAIARNVFNR